jgi:transposase
MARSKKGEAEKKWRGVLESWDGSGLSLRAFAIREGLNVGSLCAWRRRLSPDGATSTSFVPVVVSDSATRSTEGFEVVLRDGMALRIPPDFDEATLARLLRALGASR